MKEAHKEEVIAEQPKAAVVTKKGTKTEVEGGEKAARKATTPKSSKFRILDGVDAGKFRGQRQIVVKALQSLGHGFHTVEAIAAKCEGLVSKTPVEASAMYHLKGLVTDQQVEAEAVKTEAKEETKEAVAA